MSDDRRDDLPPGVDEVGKAYRAARFREEPPAHVDAVVLAAARRLERRARHRHLPALAAAATILLGLGVVLRLTIPSDGSSEPSQDAAQRASPAAERREEPRALMLERGAPLPESATTTERSADAEARPSADGVPLQGFQDGAPAPGCAESRGAEPQPWLACIRARLERGQIEAGRAELADFARVHPDYPLPEDLARRLEE